MKYNRIPDAIEYYQRQLIDGTARDNVQKIPVHLGIQFELVRELVEKRVECGTQNSLYNECYEQFLKGIGYAKELSVDAMVAQYKKVYDAFYTPYMNAHEHVYEHYAVNYAFKNIFPFGKPGIRDVFDEYVMLVVNYAMIKLHLVGLAGYHEGLDDDTAINLIYSFTRTVEHSEKYLDLVFDFFSRTGFNTMGYMAIIIKS
jgi:lysine-N-methylase